MKIRNLFLTIVCILSFQISFLPLSAMNPEPQEELSGLLRTDRAEYASCGSVVGSALKTSILGFCAEEMSNLDQFKRFVDDVLTLSREEREKILVTFDFDDTLVEFKKPWMQAGFYNTIFQEVLFTNIFQNYGYFNKDSVYGTVWIRGGYKLCNPGIKKLISKLQQAGVKTLCLTRTVRGTFGMFKNFEDYKIAATKKLGVDFGLSFNENETKLLTQKFDGQAGRPLFKEGFLFCDQLPKGVVLQMFLTRLNSHDWCDDSTTQGWSPTLVASMDDLWENLEDEMAAINAYANHANLNIKFCPFFYCECIHRFNQTNNPKHVEKLTKMATQEMMECLQILASNKKLNEFRKKTLNLQ